jgi:hypothetical protein
MKSSRISNSTAQKKHGDAIRRGVPKYLPMSVATPPGARGNATSQSFSKWIFLVSKFKAALLAQYAPTVTGESMYVETLPAPEVMSMNFGADLLALRRWKKAWNRMTGAMVLIWWRDDGRVSPLSEG